MSTSSSTGNYANSSSLMMTAMNALTQKLSDLNNTIINQGTSTALAPPTKQQLNDDLATASVIPQPVTGSQMNQAEAAATQQAYVALSRVGGVMPTPPTVATDQSVLGIDQSSSSGASDVDQSLHNQQQTAVTMAMLGEHGGPAFARNAYMESYGLQQQLRWANTASGQLSSPWAQQALGNVPGGGLVASAASTIGNATDWATKSTANAAMAYGLYKLGSGAVSAVGNIGDSLTDARNLGGQLGQQTSGGLPANFLGMSDQADITGATGTGVGIKLVEEALQGRSFRGSGGGGVGAGLPSALAQSDIQDIVGQGFGANENIDGTQGDVTSIAQGLFRPLQQGDNQIDASSLGQFVPMLRNANTSVSQLVDTLSNLQAQSAATKENVNMLASSLAATGTAFEQMGGSPSQGAALGGAFTNMTGLDPQIASQLAQNPMFQGFAMSQAGVTQSGWAIDSSSTSRHSRSCP